jgi:hypothetical protein
MVMLAVADTFAASRLHRKILVAHRSMGGAEDDVVTGPRFVVGGRHTCQPTVPDCAPGGLKG